MAKTKDTELNAISTLTLIVDYDEVPSDEDIQEVIDKARERGGITKAEFTVHRAVTKSFV